YFHLGDYLFSIYLTGIIYLISINISFRSLNSYFQNKQVAKYAKSLLPDDETRIYLEKIRNVIENEEFYSGSHASLDEVAKKARLSRHIVSQVINESIGKTFFEYLAQCRIDRAKVLLKDPKYHNITIDEISFMVGYNSRSAFNRVFKSLAGMTPTEYRNHK
ncbi:MAG TPA: AraC family transcriptional regulator, partial [Salinimicrobium catena]|nr:AraC family transcriptional regulator [Salinimicrobium catena]